MGILMPEELARPKPIQEGTDGAVAPLHSLAASQAGIRFETNHACVPIHPETKRPAPLSRTSRLEGGMNAGGSWSSTPSIAIWNGIRLGTLYINFLWYVGLSRELERV